MCQGSGEFASVLSTFRRRILIEIGIGLMTRQHKLDRPLWCVSLDFILI